LLVRRSLVRECEVFRCLGCAGAGTEAPSTNRIGVASDIISSVHGSSATLTSSWFARPRESSGRLLLPGCPPLGRLHHWSGVTVDAKTGAITSSSRAVGNTPLACGYYTPFIKNASSLKPVQATPQLRSSGRLEQGEDEGAVALFLLGRDFMSGRGVAYCVCPLCACQS
jgi:hypothetical protein